MFTNNCDYFNSSNYYSDTPQPSQMDTSEPIYCILPFASPITIASTGSGNRNSSQQVSLPFSITSILGEDNYEGSSQRSASSQLHRAIEDGLVNSEVPASTLKTALPLYQGRTTITKFGKNALLYCIPETQLAYTFSLQRKNKSFDVYICAFCKSEGTYVSVKVTSNQFLTDHCSIGHRCSPRPYVQETTTRILYQKMDEIRADERFAHLSANRLWLGGMEKIHEEISDESVKAEVLSEHISYGFDRRKRQFTRNLAHHKDKRASMAFVPSDLDTLSDGEPFLQEYDPSFRIYYSHATIQNACSVGLQAIVADGVHTPQPKELGRHSQLYCVHGVCDGGFDVPLMFAITAKKTERVHNRILDHLKVSMERAGRSNDGEGLRIVLDFEKAAINAAKSLLPKAKIERRSFHLGQAWNRKKNAVGLQQHIQGPMRDRRISRWWATIKGVVFLPEELRNNVRALRAPPVTRAHPAYDKCTQFLGYMKSTWLTGPFKDLWSKWKISTLRTTNVAEAFHSSLKNLLGCDHPDLATLIKLLRVLNLKAKCTLQRKIANPDEMKRLRRRDADRRIKVDREVTRFAGRLHGRGVSTREVTKFCIRMSRHVTGRAI